MESRTLRTILYQYGEILRIYLKPENSDTQVRRTKTGGFRGQLFAEGWVEFAKKGVAKSVASMLNGEAKQKVKEESGEPQQELQVAKVVRLFPQTKPVERVAKNKSKLSKDILAGVFGGGSP